MQHIIDNHPDMATALLAGEKLKELILPGQQDDKAGALAALLLQLKLELPFDRVVTIGTVLIPILLVTLVFTKNFAGKGGGEGGRGGTGADGGGQPPSPAFAPWRARPRPRGGGPSLTAAITEEAAAASRLGRCWGGGKRLSPSVGR